MQDFYIYREPALKKLLNNYEVEVLDASYCNDFNNFISTEYVWDLTRVDWEKSNKPNCFLRWDDFDINNITNFLSTSRLSLHDHVSIIYSWNQPGLIIKYKDLASNLKTLSWSFGVKRGVHFLVGCDYNQYKLPKLYNEDFIEIDHRCMITPLFPQENGA